MDKVVEAVETAKKEWDEAYSRAKEHIKAIQGFGGKSREEQNSNSLPRLNGLAQDALALLSSLQFRLDLLAPQLPTDDQVQSATALLHSWKNDSHNLRQSLRNANLQAKANMRKAAQEEAGMTSAAESITDSLRRTRQLMVQEVERSASTLMTVEESTGVLKKAESEYKGHRSLLMRTRNLLSTMQRQDVLDRVILAVGFFLFSCAVLYVVSKRFGILKLQQKVTAAIKAGMVGQAKIEDRAVANGINDNAVHRVDVPLDRPMHDEL
ncbi:hypothetical protein CFP56_044176 [Quercus suber]|uniref:Sec20 C-terminal domain-containing protein n=1 Tax=Quercus suber TaxID=58331 RepID=A0AAW0IP53_QUESU